MMISCSSKLYRKIRILNCQELSKTSISKQSCRARVSHSLLYHTSTIVRSESKAKGSKQRVNVNSSITTPVADDITLYKDQNLTWVDTHAPPALVPYLKLIRIDRPIGTYLLWLPCCWGIALASPAGQLPPFDMLATFGVGAFLMRSAGCTINDLWDRDFDAKVARTRLRPLASGAITPTQALAFLSVQLGGALGVLLTLNPYTIKMCLASMGLVVTYPLMKRITDWPQLYLGLAMNWGALVGYSAVAGHCDWAVCGPLYVSGVAWTIVYDTIYSHQDKDDDRALGLRSTALLMGDRTKLILTGFATASTASLIVTGSAAELSWPFYAGVVGCSAHYAWQISTARLSDRLNLTQRFVANQWLGAAVAGSIMAGKLL